MLTMLIVVNVIDASLGYVLSCPCLNLGGRLGTSTHLHASSSCLSGWSVTRVGGKWHPWESVVFLEYQNCHVQSAWLPAQGRFAYVWDTVKDNTKVRFCLRNCLPFQGVGKNRDQETPTSTSVLEHRFWSPITGRMLEPIATISRWAPVRESLCSGAQRGGALTGSSPSVVLEHCHSVQG